VGVQVFQELQGLVTIKIKRIINQIHAILSGMLVGAVERAFEPDEGRNVRRNFALQLAVAVRVHAEIWTLQCVCSKVLMNSFKQKHYRSLNKQ
jgi:hypothetical protein